METLTAIAATVTSLIFSEAFKEGGKALGKDASEKIAHLIAVIRQKFQESEIEGLLTRAEKQPTETNITKVRDELEEQMKEDEIFAKNLEKDIKELEKVEITRQIMLSGVKKGKNLKVKRDLTQKASVGGSVEQIMASGDWEIDGDIEFDGDLTQEC